ncbi:hypothetical protein [Pseudoxanthomonas dokdonensis]|uniref:Lipoprotein n=1 Tax=Pseudoxanthomonas dokdonensis TaxID=344882 RepID=A0A0R0CKC6_9GAMM|nr:hypothetical protein [Pseudoxanthomonas dokdonensis]KRG70441.1 lipoprotein [Pseudoxanthomonas dokdonensis]
MNKPVLMLACVLALAACGDRQAEQAAAAAAQARQQEQQAEELGKRFDSAVAGGDWDMARIHGVALLDQYPKSATAKRIAPKVEEIKAKAEAEREQRRLDNLWAYAQVNAAGGIQRSAMIYSQDNVDVDGSGAKPVQLVFRDHPKWKRSSYLVLQGGDFAKACYRSCPVTVVVDDGKPRRMSANRPDTDEAIAMFIDDDKTLWKLAGEAKRLQISFPLANGDSPTVIFETGGLDPKQMPGW